MVPVTNLIHRLSWSGPGYQRSFATQKRIGGLPFEKREAVVRQGLDFGNGIRVVWEAAAAVPFTAFCAAALVPNATASTASGYRVMGHPGAAPNGHRGFSYRRRLAVERTRTGSLP